MLAFAARCSLRMGGVVLLLGLALLVSTRALYADTITIVAGGNVAPPGDGSVYNDGYLAAQLVAGNFTINTTDSTGGGPGSGSDFPPQPINPTRSPNAPTDHATRFMTCSLEVRDELAAIHPIRQNVTAHLPLVHW